MSESINQVQIQLLEKSYTIACPREERQTLLDSAQLLDEKMRETRDQGKVLGSERIAVMSALNLARELLLAQKKIDSGDEALELVKRLSNRIEQDSNEE